MPSSIVFQAGVPKLLHGSLKSHDSARRSWESKIEAHGLKMLFAVCGACCWMKE